MTKSITGYDHTCKPADHFQGKDADCGPKSKSKKKCADNFNGCEGTGKDGGDCADFADKYNECPDDPKYETCNADGFNGDTDSICKNGKDKDGKPCRPADSYNPSSKDGRCVNGKDRHGRRCRQADDMSDTCEGGCCTRNAGH